jgi:hypothetical protein
MAVPVGVVIRQEPVTTVMAKFTGSSGAILNLSNLSVLGNPQVVSETGKTLMPSAQNGEVPAHKYVVTDMSKTYFRVLPVTDMSPTQLSQALQQRAAFKKALFRSSNTQLGRTPKLSDIPDCSNAAEMATGQCLFNPDNIPRVASASSSPRRVAVMIGINQYDDPDIPQLTGAIPDVNGVKNLMLNQLGYEVQMLYNARKSDVFKTLNKVVSELQENDSLLVYYAGHGETVESYDVGFWIPRDGKADDPRGWVANSDVNRLLTRALSKQIAVVSDSCYSGRLVPDPQMPAEQLPNNLLDYSQRRAVTVMTSGNDEPVADTGKDGQSVFAWNLIHKIREVNGWANGATVFKDVKTAVEKELPQSPQYGVVEQAGHERGSDYLFIKNKDRGRGLQISQSTVATGMRP